VLANAPLRVRVMAVAAILVTVTSAVTGWLGIALLSGYLLGQADTQLRDFASVATRILARPHRPVRRAGQSGLPTPFLVQVVSASGRTRMVSDPAPDRHPPQLSAAQQQRPSGPFTVAAAGAPGHDWRVLVRTLPGGRHVVIASSLDSLDSTVTRLQAADAAAGAVALALLVILGLPLVRLGLAPLARIERTAAAIAAGDLSQRISHPSHRSEVGRLAGALNSMLSRIEAAYRARAEGEARALDSGDRMRRFVADASHELRTPLTSVRGLAEFSLQQGEAASRAELLRLMTLIQAEAARMGRLVEDLLLLAQFDEHRPLERHPVDLSSIAAEAVRAAGAVRRDHLITVRAGEPVIVQGDHGRLRQIIDNLIGNAFQHTPPGSAVTVTVASSPICGELTVTDNGPGMTRQQAAQVFERFYRADRARSRSHGGTGLGLSIAATLASAHGGSISVDTQPGRGAAFRVQLPLAAGPEPSTGDGRRADDRGLARRPASPELATTRSQAPRP
jgi:two-component system OmpR family sensor kinase